MVRGAAFWLLSFFVLFSLLVPKSLQAFSVKNPEKTGVALVVGSSYAPQPTFEFAQLSLMALYDYEQIMPHRAPEALRFKFEGNVGLADVSPLRALVSGNFFALYYLQDLQFGSFLPYLEGGAGVVFSDFQVEGQGLRINFNPQAGIGTEWQGGNRSYYGAVRIYHLSNSGLHQDNRGINAVTLQIGAHF